MSDMETAFTDAMTISGDWWWIAALILHRLDMAHIDQPIFDVHPIRWEQERATGSLILKGYSGGMLVGDYVFFLAIAGRNGQTTIQYAEAYPHYGFWGILLEQVTPIARQAQDLQRMAHAPRFEELLVQFYAARGRKESPKLSEMARAAGVSYTALRQYKVKYDKRLKGKL